MTIPSALIIEAAAEQLRVMDLAPIARQEAELQSFGDTRAQRLMATGLSVDFIVGYNLGLQTARAMLQMGLNPKTL